MVVDEFALVEGTTFLHRGEGFDCLAVDIELDYSAGPLEVVLAAEYEN